MQGTKVIRVYPDGLKKLDKINSERPQDMSRADTFEYVLRVFEESPIRIEICKELTKRNTIIPGRTSPIIDVDNLRIVTPLTMGDKIRRDALKAANEAPTKNNTYQESKE